MSRVVMWGALFVGTATMLSVWIARRPIAGHFIDGELARRGVQARYVIRDLGLGRQRLTDVVIGDPRAPDLVADWIETDTGIGWSGPFLRGVRAGRVRLRATQTGSRISLGSIDQLLPPPSNAPFVLPDIGLAVDDGRIALVTAYGAFTIALSGRGLLVDDWRGAARVETGRLAIGDCRGDAIVARLDVTISTAVPRLVGPVRASRARCGGSVVAAPLVSLDARLTPTLDGWRGHAGLHGDAIDAIGIRARSIEGQIGFVGTPRATSGGIDLGIDGAEHAIARIGRISVAGRYGVGRGLRFAGIARWNDAELRSPPVEPLAALGRSRGNPLAPLTATLARAASAAALGASGMAEVRVQTANGNGSLQVNRATWRGGSGATVRFAGGGVHGAWPGGVWGSGRLSVAGGGLPSVDAVIARAGADAPVRGVVTVAPYAAGRARLALAPVRFVAGPRGNGAVTTRATLSGPIENGRIEALTVPIDARFAPGAVYFNPRCFPVAWQRMNIAGTDLLPARLDLCPLERGKAVVSLADGAAGGGVALPAARLTGRLGDSPLTLAWRRAEVDLSRLRFAIDGVETRIGTPERPTRIDAGRIRGQLASGGATGDISDGGGRIGAVPLILSDASGEWRFAEGTLTLGGALGVSDAQTASPRFKPMRAEAVTLALANGVIVAAGTLIEPTTTTKVATVRIAHDLSGGRGNAELAVDGISFSKGFQPDLLTPLTFGVVADVRGTVKGRGAIDWSGDAVRSTGTFSTDGTDLAAAFGPVTGLATTIQFTDLLALASAPHQVATVASINPGVAVTDGWIGYQLLPGTRVRVEDGHWPFAGGTLTLDPTELDFGAARQRRLTFRVTGMAADRFLQQFDFKNLEATGTFDGVLPMVFDETGGRIERGTLAVREGGGAIAYVGELGQKQLGVWGDVAFQALRSLRYRNLEITMNGPLSGEMITRVRFAGISQGKGARSNFLVRRLQRLPFVFNVTVRAPFRGLLDSAQSFYDPKRLIARNLPQLIERQNDATSPAAPPANETMP